MTEKLIKSDKATLTGKKLKMAQMLANPEFTGTNKDLCKIVGISHDTFYRWIREEGEILDYAERLISKYSDAELSAVWKSLIRECKKGEIQAIKLFFELKGKYNQTVNVSGMGCVQIINDIPRGDEDG